jgi:exonuclease III
LSQAVGAYVVCCLRLDAEKFKLLLVCIYMPHESDEASTELFVSQLSVLNNIIAANRDCSVIVGGDMNVDLSREWQHTTLLRDFCDMTMLFPVITHSLSSIDYTYHFNKLRFNVLDHFLLSGDMFETCIRCVSVMHDVDNASDHEPLILHLDISIARLVSSSSCYTYRPVWSKASREEIENYKSELQACLQRVVIPYQALFCRDALCSNVEH